MQQQPPPLRPGNGQHRADCAAAWLRIVGILDLIAPRAGPAIDRAHALRQGEPLGSPPRARVVITIGRDQSGAHDARYRRDDGAASDLQDLALPGSGTSGHIPSRATHSVLSVARADGMGRLRAARRPEGTRRDQGEAAARRRTRSWTCRRARPCRGAGSGRPAAGTRVAGLVEGSSRSPGRRGGCPGRSRQRQT